MVLVWQAYVHVQSSKRAGVLMVVTAKQKGSELVRSCHSKRYQLFFLAVWSFESRIYSTKLTNTIILNKIIIKLNHRRLHLETNNFDKSIGIL